MLSIKSNEIVLLDFAIYTPYLSQHFSNTIYLVNKFAANFRNLYKRGKVESHITELEKETEKIIEEIKIFIGYLDDYQIEVRNSFLSHLFKKTIPKRIPQKNRKTLQEILPRK